MRLFSTHPTTGIKTASEVSYGITTALGLQTPSNYRVVSFTKGIFTRVISTAVSVGPFLVLNKERIQPLLTLKNVAIAGYDVAQYASYPIKYAASLTSKLPSLPFTIPAIPLKLSDLPIKYVTLPYRVAFSTGFNAIHSIGYLGHSIVKLCSHDKDHRYAAKASFIRSIAFATFAAATYFTFTFCKDERVWACAAVSEGALNLLFPNQLRDVCEKITSIFDILFFAKTAQPKGGEKTHSRTIGRKAGELAAGMKDLTSPKANVASVAGAGTVPDSPSARTRSKTKAQQTDGSKAEGSVKDTESASSVPVHRKSCHTLTEAEIAERRKAAADRKAEKDKEKLAQSAPTEKKAGEVDVEDLRSLDGSVDTNIGVEKKGK